MARKSVTEEELGLAPTEEEMAEAPATIEADDTVEADNPPEAEKKTKPDDTGDEPVKADTKKEPEPDKKPDDEPKMVDVRALQEARREIREAREHAATLEQRWNDFLAGQNKPAETKPDDPFADAPDPEADPMGWIKWRQQRDREEYAERQKTTQEQREAADRESAFRQHQDYVQEHYNEAVKSDPAVDEAFKAAWASYEQELKFLGYKGHQLQQGMQQVFHNFTMAASQAVQSGQPIADFVKGIAQTRGWQQQAATPTPEQPAKKDLAAVAATQERHQSLSDAPGGDAPAPLDAKALAKMSDKDFKAWMSKRGSEQKFDEIMGG